jgi:hypothetical protein
MANSILSSLVSLSLILSPLASHAKAPATAPRERVKISADQADKIFTEAALMYFVSEYKIARTPQRYAEQFLKGLSPKDRALFDKGTKNMKQLPSVKLQGLGLVFQEPGQASFKIEVVDRWKNQFRINGRLWSYDPKASLSSQLEIIKHNYQPTKTSLLWDAMIPSAEADFGASLILVAITAAVTTLVTTGFAQPVINVVSKLFCDYTNLSLGWDTQSVDLCTDWAKKRQELADKDAPRLDAIKKMIASDQSNVLGKFEVKNESSCPDNSDGKPRVYQANLVVKESNEPISIRAEFTPDGNAKEFRIVDRETGKDLATLEFDNKEVILTCASVAMDAGREVAAATRNTRQGAETPAATPPPTVAPIATPAPNALTPKNLEMCRNQTNLSAPELARLKLLGDVARFVNLRVTRCTVQSAAEQVAHGNTVASPVQPNARPNVEPAANTPATR